MSCVKSTPIYIPAVRKGLRSVNSIGDGYSMQVSWYSAYPTVNGYNIAYNLYFASTKENVFDEGVKFTTNTTNNGISLIDFVPGDLYYWAVRATQYDPNWYDLAQLPTVDDAYVYPETLLASNITSTDAYIQILDNINLFPSYGVILVGHEYIRYSSKNTLTSTLNVSQRGFLGSDATLHNTDGYNGIKTYSPIVKFFKGLEEDNENTIFKQCTFNNPYYAYTITDGYKDKIDVITSKDDLSAEAAERVDFRSYDYSGWHRTDPRDLFQGKCLDTYIGGESFCADSSVGVGRQIRNMSLSERADRSQEMLLDTIGTGEEVVLLKRMWSGKTCRCYEPNSEYPQARCPSCYGTGIVSGYEQYYNPRKSSGRILVRFGPAAEDLKREEGGIENSIIFDCWTLSTPILTDSDILIRFNIDGTEEWRYEILDVTRNKLLYGETARQTFKAQRIRKTSPMYQIKAFRNTEFLPLKIQTLTGFMKGPQGIVIPHTHEIVLSESITDISQINQMTGISLGHNHSVINGIISSSLSHSHTIPV